MEDSDFKVHTFWICNCNVGYVQAFQVVVDYLVLSSHPQSEVDPRLNPPCQCLPGTQCKR